MELLREILDGLYHTWLSFLAALLPNPERERLRREREVDPPRSSLTLGIVQGAAGAYLFMVSGIAFVRYGSVMQSMFLVENWWPGLSTTHFQGTGLVSWLAWFLHPLAWLFGFIALTGLVRCVAFAVSREAVAEPLVWVGLRAYQAIRGRFAARARRKELGPDRPDRTVSGPEGEITVLTCREQPEWNEQVTIEVEGRFYRLVGVEERDDGPWIVLAYRLRAQKEGEVIRRLVRWRGSDKDAGTG